MTIRSPLCESQKNNILFSCATPPTRSVRRDLLTVWQLCYGECVLWVPITSTLQRQPVSFTVVAWVTVDCKPKVRWSEILWFKLFWDFLIDICILTEWNGFKISNPKVLWYITAAHAVTLLQFMLLYEFVCSGSCCCLFGYTCASDRLLSMFSHGNWINKINWIVGKAADSNHNFIIDIDRRAISLHNSD